MNKLLEHEIFAEILGSKIYDSATSWIEPTDAALIDALDMLDENGYEVTQEDFAGYVFYEALWHKSNSDSFSTSY